MKQEYIDRINLAKECFRCDKSMSDEQFDKNIDIGWDLLEKLISTRDIEVLHEVLDFFTKENEQLGGFGEHFSTEIGDNFQLSQILHVLYKKLNKLLTNDFEIAGDMCMWFLWHNMFDEFREMFNTVKPKLAEKLLDEMLSCDAEYAEHINLLRDDMKSW